MTYTALILAGSRDGKPDVVATAHNLPHKAFVRINDRPMIHWVINALEDTPEIDRIILCANDAKRWPILSPNMRTLATQPTISATVAQAVSTLGTPLLITTADHPLLTPAWIQFFVAQSQGDCDLAIAIASREIVERDVPGTSRTYIRLKGLVFSGCNLFWIANPKALTLIHLWQRVERYRKKPWRMAALLGWRMLFDAVVGRLTAKRLCRHIERLTGVRVRFVTMPDGAAAVDVDKMSDLDLVRQLFAERQ